MVFLGYHSTKQGVNGLGDVPLRPNYHEYMKLLPELYVLYGAGMYLEVTSTT